MARRSPKKIDTLSEHQGDSQRLDKWLWHARFVRTRGAATALVEKTRFRINGRTGIKPSALVRIDDVLTFNLSGRVRVIKLTGIAERRGSASDAALLYSDLDTEQKD